MKTVFDRLPGWTACVVVLMLMGFQTKAASPGSSPRGATVVRVHGKARYSTDNQTWQPIKKGTVLQAGNVIQTAANSSLDIRLSGNERDSRSGEPAEGILRLEADSLLGIERLSVEGAGNVPPQDVELDLRAGQVAGNAGQLPASSHYEIKFAKGIAGVRDGVYHISSSGFVAVPSGETVVVILGADGNPVTTQVSAGKQFNPNTGSVSNLRPGSTNPSPVATPEQHEPAPVSPTQKGPGMGGSLRKF
ncbi:MAG TPA: hypothetical protein VFB72_08985 [Verrucomicrobiae bacterium]|nr:hypothetical protein [Verrucomicrobiae bacterium]